MSTARIWSIAAPLEAVARAWSEGLTAHLAITPLACGDNWLSARMPVTPQTLQPHGIMHGGASLVLAETLASAGAYMCLDHATQSCVGLELNANHLRSVRDGHVDGVATAIHIGRSTHVWDVRISDAAGALLCISRCTMAILTLR